MFEELKGIQGVRNVKQTTKGSLEKLVELGSQLEREITAESSGYLTLFQERLPELYNIVKDADISYNEHDIQDLAVALSSQEPQNPKIRGVYIGALVSLLTEKNNKKGKRTIVELDLKGSEFPYLCAGAKYADVLMIKNVKGDCIGEGIAYNRGQAGIVILQDIIGEYAGWRIARDHGQAGIVILQDIIGEYAGWSIARDHGQAGIISAKNIESNYVGDCGNYDILDNKGKYSSQIREFTDGMIKKYSESRMTFEELMEEIGKFTKGIKSGGEDV